jgi:hypothetical protein
VLEALVRRPTSGGGSLTTLLPGYVYASATVMKVCIVAGLAAVVIGAIESTWGRTKREAPRGPFVQRLPAWALGAIALAVSTPVAGAVVVVVTQAFADQPGGLSPSDFAHVSRTAVLVKLWLISAGVLAAAMSLVKNERPFLLATLGLIVNCVLIGLFWRLEFYALGFDQDTWAPR